MQSFMMWNIFNERPEAQAFSCMTVIHTRYFVSACGTTYNCAEGLQNEIMRTLGVPELSARTFLRFDFWFAR